MKHQRGAYAVEFIVTFLVFFSVAMIAIEVSRYFLVRSMLDFKFREMVYDSRTDAKKSVEYYVDRHFTDRFYFSRKNVTVTAKNCEDLEAYSDGKCSSGKGFQQYIVRYEMKYSFTPIVPIYLPDGLRQWDYRSVVVMRNEPDFSGGQW
ncbi:hypothetical protein QWZ04_08930 [Vibrio tapetis subsp. quintayensis]|uniref:TadE/TadG family type IV pilus assembly protein n=1 Tax=Vibrio tapetis TaxID=52443 RepID=UPI0025B5A6B5|nr:TadE/TadG family type IV pilus assembly protein [Vibrio tapetis]MDN3680449.1 hypothetical protein [Vibrio tapetis subsp. quintayensis]